MSIVAEYCPEPCLREFGTIGRQEKECIPENLEVSQTYEFLKKGQRHYWIKGEIALRKTKGNQELSRPIASVVILEVTHFVKDGEVWTKDQYKVVETYNINDPTIHFETTDKVKSNSKDDKIKITICGSSIFREEMINYKKKLKDLGHDPIVHPDYEAFVRSEKQEIVDRIEKEHADVKKENNYIKWYHDAISDSDAVLVLNFDKKGVSNYIGGNTLMEIGFAHTKGKKIFLLNDVPDVSYKDEILAMYDVVLNGDLTKIK